MSEVRNGCIYSSQMRLLGETPYIHIMYFSCSGAYAARYHVEIQPANVPGNWSLYSNRTYLLRQSIWKCYRIKNSSFWDWNRLMTHWFFMKPEILIFLEEVKYSTRTLKDFCHLPHRRVSCQWQIHLSGSKTSSFKSVDSWNQRKSLRKYSSAILTRISRWKNPWRAFHSFSKSVTIYVKIAWWCRCCRSWTTCGGGTDWTCRWRPTTWSPPSWTRGCWSTCRIELSTKCTFGKVIC